MQNEFFHIYELLTNNNCSIKDCNHIENFVIKHFYIFYFRSRLVKLILSTVNFKNQHKY